MIAKKRHTVEQIIHKLREAEVALFKGEPLSKVVRKPQDRRADVLPLAEGVWRPADGPGPTTQRAGAGERPAEDGSDGPDAGQRRTKSAPNDEVTSSDPAVGLPFRGSPRRSTIFLRVPCTMQASLITKPESRITNHELAITPTRACRSARRTFRRSIRCPRGSCLRVWPLLRRGLSPGRRRGRHGW